MVSSRFGLNTGIAFEHFGLKLGMFCLLVWNRVYIFTILAWKGGKVLDWLGKIAYFGQKTGGTPPPQISRSTPQASEQRKKRRNINERHISETSHSLRPPLNFSSSFLSRSKKFNLPYTVVMGDPLFWVVTRGETLRDDSTLCLLLKIIYLEIFSSWK